LYISLGKTSIIHLPAAFGIVETLVDFGISPCEANSIIFRLVDEDRMAQSEDFRRTIVYGETALGHLRKNEIPAFPRHYELWYTYAAGFNHALNRAVNEILRSTGRISTLQVSELYDKFVSPSRLGERIEEVGGQLSDEIHGLLSMIESSLSTAGTYGKSLDGAATALSGTTDPERLRAVVSLLIDATRESQATNKQLEGSLAESREEILKLQHSLETIRFESLMDDLTSLANRKHFDMSIQRMADESEHSGGKFSLLMTDIDFFKKFNDTWGHQTGDQVLRLVALAVRQNVKGQDVACRYGGEEFAILLPGTNLRQATIVAEHIREAVMSKELIKRSTGENLGRITISIGVASWQAGDSPQEIVARADAALYAAKRGGRNLVRCEADPDVQLNAMGV
jgi:diguanylate cyclase